MQGFGIVVGYVMSKIEKPIRWGSLETANMYSWSMLFFFVTKIVLTYEMYLSQKRDKG